MAPTSGMLSIAEGAQGTFTVALSRAPDVSLTVNVTSSAPTVVAVMPATITFNATNFAVPQTVTVTGVQDADTVNGTADVALAANGVASASVRVDVTDDDVQGIQATPTGLSIPEGMVGHFDVRLAAAPGGSVTIAVASGTPGKATVGPATLTFTAANYATAQSVTVTSLQDPDVADDTVNVTLTSTGLPTVTVPVLIADDDQQGVSVTPTAISVTEGNATPVVFQVHLNQMPSSAVTVNVASSNIAAATVSPATLTFTTANYLTDQPVSVLAANDDNTIGETVTLNVTSAGLTTRTVTVTTVDNDTQAIIATPTSVTVLEGGTTTFSVHLAFNPSSSVSVNIASSDATKATTGSTALTFNAGNFATPQLVTVQGVPDDDLAPNTATLTLALAGSPSVTVPVTVNDDDVQSLIVTPLVLGVLEGSTAPFTVRLAFRPAASTTVTATSSAVAAASVSPGTLTFSPAAFATPQTVTVTGVQDTDTVDSTANVTVASTGAPSVTVGVTVTDDDRQVILARPSNVALVEGGPAGTLQVHLNFAPSAPTTVMIVSDNVKVTTVPTTLTFGPADFATDQPVTINAANDADAINEVAALTFSAAGIMDSVVNVTVADDDIQSHVVSATSVSVLEQEPVGATFNVHLSAQPLTNLTVTIASAAPATVSASPTTLVFTPGNYATDQLVTVLGLADPNLSDETVNVTVSSSAAPTVAVTVHVQDDDLQDLVVSPQVDVLPNVGALAVIEDAVAPATIGVSLKFQPDGSKGVRVLSNFPSVLINGQPFVDLLFTTTNYGMPQILTLTTPTDNNLDQPVDTTVTVGLCETICSSAVFVGIKTVTADAQDDDVQRIITSDATVPIGENPLMGGNFTVRLAFEPLASGTETVSVTSGDTGAAIVTSEGSLAFNAGNYLVPQVVTVAGVQDLDVNNEIVPMTLHSSFPTTPNATVTVNVTDDDIQALILSETSATIYETPTTPNTTTFTVRLQFDPTGTAAGTVSLTSADPMAASVSPATLTFDASNYTVPQTVTVNSVSDEDVRDEEVIITASATGAQPVTFTATVFDDDSQGLVVASTASVIEEGTSLLPVHLAFQPTNPVTVSATLAIAAGKVTVSGPLTFTPANYLVDQNFTLTGLVDADLDDVTGSLTVSGLATGPIGEHPPDVVVSLTVLDDDVQSILVSWAPAAINSVEELGPDGSFQMHLAFPPRLPGDDVVQVTVPAGLLGHAKLLEAGSPVDSTTLTFTVANFATNQTVAFRGIADGDSTNDEGDLQLLIDEQDDVSGPNANVTSGAHVRLMDRSNTVVDTQADPTLLGGTQFTERANIQWATTSFLLSGRNAAGVYSVATDNLTLTGFAGGAGIGTAAADSTTQSIEWNGADFGVFATDAGAIRYTQVSTLGAALGTSAFANGASEFWVTHNPSAQRYAVLYRTPANNLLFNLVQYNGTVSSAQLVTSPDAIPDQAPNVLYVGGTSGLDYSFGPAIGPGGAITPYVGLYTTSTGLVCVRLTATGALVPQGSIDLSSAPDFNASVWTGSQVAAVHYGSTGLHLDLIGLSGSGSPCTTTTSVLLGAPDTYVNTPSIAFNGTELAVGYDVRRIIDPVAGTADTRVGVILYNPTTHLSSSHVFNDIPGERPSMTWAGDRWLLRYATPTSVIVRSGSLAEVSNL